MYIENIQNSERQNIEKTKFDILWGKNSTCIVSNNTNLEEFIKNLNFAKFVNM